MSKTLSRKSLALGTILTLGFSALTGVAPAQAADLVTLVPTAGTSYNTPLAAGSNVSYSLKTYFAAAAQAAGTDQLRVNIVDATEGLLIGAGGTQVNATTTVTRDATTKAINVALGNTAGVAAAENIVLVPKSTLTSTFSVTVQTWVDSDGDTLPNDANKSEVRTIKFLQASAITASVSLSELAFGESTASATVALTPDINLEQRSSDGDAAAAEAITLPISVEFGNSGTTGTLTYVSANTFKAPVTGLSTSATTITVSAKLTDNAQSPATAADVTLGSTTKALVDHSVSGSTSRTVATASADLAQASETATSAVVRVGSTSHNVVVTVKNSSDAAVGAGVLVRAAITGTLNRTAGASATDTVSVRGVLVGAASADTAAFTALTDANGKISIPVVATGGTANTSVKITLTSEGKTLPELTLTWSAATYTATIDQNVAKYTTYTVSRVVGSTTPISVTVVDQFKQPIAAGYDARLLIGSATVTATRTTAGSNEYTSALSAGKASFNHVDNGVGANSTGDVYRVQVAKKLGNGNYDTAVATSENIVFIYTASAGTATATLAAASGSLDSVTGDAARKTTTAVVRSTGDAGVFDTSSTGGVAITVATGIAGQNVTLSGTGLAFKVTGGTAIVKKDSITANAPANGTLAVTILSQKAGKQVITITAGGATSYLEATFAAPSATSGVAVNFTAPTSALAKKGRTLTFTGVLTDKYGNGVDTSGTTFRAVYDGPGLEVTDDVVKTDAYGKFSVKVLLGSDDSGLASVVVDYDGATVATTDDYTITKTVLVGASASVSAGSKKANVVVKGVEGLTVKVVSGTKVTSKVATSDNFKLSLSKLTSGSKTVKVYVNDILVTSKKVSIKK